MIVLRIALALVGMIAVLWLENPRSGDHLLNPWLLGALLFCITLFVFEAVLSRGRMWISHSGWRIVGSSIGGAALFGITYLALVLVVASVGREFFGDLGIKILNSMSRVRFMSFDFGIVFGFSHLVTCYLSKVRGGD